METEEAIAAVWETDFQRTYTVWGKEIVLRALNGPEISSVNRMVAKAEPEDKAQALAILTVASALVSVDGEPPFGRDAAGAPRVLSLPERAQIVSEWLDGIQAAIQRRYNLLQDEFSDTLDGIADPNSSAPHEATTAPS